MEGTHARAALGHCTDRVCVAAEADARTTHSLCFPVTQECPEGGCYGLRGPNAIAHPSDDEHVLGLLVPQTVRHRRQASACIVSVRHTAASVLTMAAGSNDLGSVVVAIAAALAWTNAPSMASG